MAAYQSMPRPKRFQAKTAEELAQQVYQYLFQLAEAVETAVNSMAREGEKNG